MKRSSPSLAALAFVSLDIVSVGAFAPADCRAVRLRQAAPSSNQIPPTALNLWLPDEHTLSSASSFVATIDSDIASIPDDEFGKVFAGGGIIIFGSILSTIFVGFLVESGGGYADLVAETYAEQNIGEEEESFLDSLGLKTAEEKKEAVEMVQAFREKKMKKAGTWTEEDEEKKQQLAAEKDMFSDYD
jgi:hypothetical protein